MIRNAAAGVALLLVLAACGADEPSPLTAEAMTILAPLPGQPAGVAYFSLHNGAATAVTLTRVTSPEFGSVEMHTTLIDGAMTHMLPIDSLTIAEGSDLEFAPGGPHLMLMQPAAELEPGDPITLEFHYQQADAGDADAEGPGLLSVSAPLESR